MCVSLVGDEAYRPVMVILPVSRDLGSRPHCDKHCISNCISPGLIRRALIIVCLNCCTVPAVASDLICSQQAACSALKNLGGAPTSPVQSGHRHEWHTAFC